jgi:hypothetical protein
MELCACGEDCRIDPSRVEPAAHANSRARRDFIDQTGGFPFGDGTGDESEDAILADLRDLYEPTDDELVEILIDVEIEDDFE